MDKALEIFGMVFVTNNQPAVIKEPSEEPFYLPAFAIAA